MKKGPILATFLMCMVLITAGCVHNVSAKGTTKVKKIALSAPSGSIKTVYVAKGKKVKLTSKIAVKPYTKKNARVIYKSANSKIATVSKKGVIKGKKRGTTKITVISKVNPKKKKTIKVKVVKPVKSMAFDYTSITLTEGRAKKLNLRISAPSDAYAIYKVKSTDSSVAVLCGKKQSTVKSYKPGKVIVTAYALDGSGKKATCVVTVLPKGASDEKETSGNITDNTTEKETSSKPAENTPTQTGEIPSGSEIESNSSEDTSKPWYGTDDGKGDCQIKDPDNLGDAGILVTIKSIGETDKKYVAYLYDETGRELGQVKAVNNKFGFSYLGLGKYTVVLKCEGYTVATSNPIVKDNDFSYDYIDMVVTQYGSISGTVEYRDGTYPEGYKAVLSTADGSQIDAIDVVNGFFSFPTVMEGTYEVSILNTDGEDETARTVTLSAGEEYIIYHKVKRYDIDREQLGIVRGTITEPTGEPLSGYTVCLYTLEEFADGTSRADKEVQRCIIAKDGKFKFIGIPEGDYTLVMLNRNGTINEVAGTIRFHDIEKFYRDTAYWTYTNVTWEIPKESIYN